MDARTRAWLNGTADRLLDRVADEVAEDARRLAPRHTGRLASSVRRSPVRSQQVEVEAAAPYAAYVELGTRDQRPQPFLRPALMKRRRI